MPPAWKELGFRSYDAYIKSRLWWNIRQLILERDGKCCQVCGSPSKMVHHIDYTKIIMLGQGDQHELITLCEPCHNFVEQDKRVSEKKNLLNKLFCQHSKNTLDEWQIWAEKFNSDIGYSRSQILEPRNNNQKKKHKTKKQEQPEVTKSKPTALSLKDEIDQFIKGHKKKKQKSPRYNANYYINKQKRKEHYKGLVPATDENRKEFITNTVRKYNRKSKKNIQRYLDNQRPLIELLFNHPEASENLKKIIAKHPYFIKESRKNETEAQKRQRKEEQYQRQREKKKTKIMGKLPLWTGNHKAKSFQGQSPLTKHLREAKEQKNSRNDA